MIVVRLRKTGLRNLPTYEYGRADSPRVMVTAVPMTISQVQPRSSLPWLISSSNTVQTAVLMSMAGMFVRLALRRVSRPRRKTPEHGTARQREDLEGEPQDVLHGCAGGGDRRQDQAEAHDAEAGDQQIVPFGGIPADQRAVDVPDERRGQRVQRRIDAGHDDGAEHQALEARRQDRAGEVREDRLESPPAEASSGCWP